MGSILMLPTFKLSKNIKIKYWMDEAGFAGHRTSFDETWVYIGAR
jgi:hypothetical protein